MNGGIKMLSEKFEYEFPMLEECPSFGTFAAGSSGRDDDEQLELPDL